MAIGSQDSAWVRDNYTKKELYITMRDGVVQQVDTPDAVCVPHPATRTSHRVEGVRRGKDGRTCISARQHGTGTVVEIAGSRSVASIGIHAKRSIEKGARSIDGVDPLTASAMTCPVLDAASKPW